MTRLLKYIILALLCATPASALFTDNVIYFLPFTDGTIVDVSGQNQTWLHDCANNYEGFDPGGKVGLGMQCSDVQAADNRSMIFLSGQSFTQCFWMYRNQTDYLTPVFEGNNNGNYWETPAATVGGSDPNEIGFGFYDNDDTVMITTGDLGFHTWNHLCAVYDESADTLTLYVNGTAVNTTTVATDPSDYVDSNVSTTRMTFFTAAGAEPLNGPAVFLDEIGAWQRPLSQDEIVTLYQAGQNDQTWPFDVEAEPEPEPAPDITTNLQTCDDGVYQAMLKFMVIVAILISLTLPYFKNDREAQGVVLRIVLALLGISGALMILTGC